MYKKKYVLICFLIILYFRTKWKRQTAVGLELLAEAGNYAAFQRLYGGPAYMTGWPYPTQGHPGASPSITDLYYRQAAAAAALQKPLPYRLYPPVPSLGPLGSLANPTPQFSPINSSSTTTSPISSLTNFYHASKGDSHSSTTRSSPSPTLNPGSPPPKKQATDHSSPNCSDDEENIQV